MNVTTDLNRWLRTRGVLQRALLFPALDAVCRPQIRGAETLTGVEGGCVIAANHTSHLDCPVLLRAMPAAVRRRTIVAAAADYFYRNRAVGAALEMTLGTIAFERDGDAAASLELCSKLLASGHVLLIFPEGTRSRDGSMKRFRSGAARLALRSGAPIVPAGVRGLHDVLPPGARIPRPNPVTVCFAAPLYPLAGEGAQSLSRRLEAEVARLVLQPSRALLGAA